MMQLDIATLTLSYISLGVTAFIVLLLTGIGMRLRDAVREADFAGRLEYSGGQF